MHVDLEQTCVLSIPLKKALPANARVRTFCCSSSGELLFFCLADSVRAIAATEPSIFRDVYTCRERKLISGIGFARELMLVSIRGSESAAAPEPEPEDERDGTWREWLVWLARSVEDEFGWTERQRVRWPFTHESAPMRFGALATSVVCAACPSRALHAFEPDLSSNCSQQIRCIEAPNFDSFACDGGTLVALAHSDEAAVCVYELQADANALVPRHRMDITGSSRVLWCRECLLVASSGHISAFSVSRSGGSLLECSANLRVECFAQADEPDDRWCAAGAQLAVYDDTRAEIRLYSLERVPPYDATRAKD